MDTFSNLLKVSVKGREKKEEASGAAGRGRREEAGEVGVRFLTPEVTVTRASPPAANKSDESVVELDVSSENAGDITVIERVKDDACTFSIGEGMRDAAEGERRRSKLLQTAEHYSRMQEAALEKLTPAVDKLARGIAMNIESPEELLQATGAVKRLISELADAMSAREGADRAVAREGESLIKVWRALVQGVSAAAGRDPTTTASKGVDAGVQTHPAEGARAASTQTGTGEGTGTERVAPKPKRKRDSPGVGGEKKKPKASDPSPSPMTEGEVALQRRGSATEEAANAGETTWATVTAKKVGKGKKAGAGADGERPQVRTAEQPRAAVPRRGPTTEAVKIMVASKDEKERAKVLKEVREGVDPAFFGTVVKGVRRTREGDTLIEVAK